MMVQEMVAYIRMQSKDRELAELYTSVTLILFECMCKKFNSENLGADLT